MGNICRSPTAHGVFEHLARQRGVGGMLKVESCGTGDWHAGELPDQRARATAARHGVELRSRARIVSPSRDFADAPAGGFDLILPMDVRNQRHLVSLGCPEHKLVLFRSFDPEVADLAHPEVPDPYGDGPDGRMFEVVFQIVMRSSVSLLDRIFPRSHHGQ
jgi:protein-tyrosine phosphatase